MRENNRKTHQKKNFAANADKYNRQLDLILTFARDNQFPDYIMEGLEQQKVSIKTVGIGYGNSWIWNSLAKLFKEHNYEILDLLSFFHRSNSNTKFGQKKAKFRAKPLQGRKAQWYKLVGNYKLLQESQLQTKIRKVLAQQRLAKKIQKAYPMESPETKAARLRYIAEQREVRLTNQAVYVPPAPLVGEGESIGVGVIDTTTEN